MTSPCSQLHRRLLRSAAAVLAVAAFLAYCVPCPAAPEIAGQRKRVDVIVVPQEERWLLSIAAPLASKLSAEGRPPILLALSVSREETVMTFMKRFDPGGCVALASAQETASACGASDVCAHGISTGSDPLEAGVLIAKRFWGKPSEVIVASLADPEAVILGATLAAHNCAPFIPCKSGDEREALREALKDLRPERVRVVVTSAEMRSLLAANLAPKTEFLSADVLQHLLIQRLGPEDVKNIILCRVPQPLTTIGISSWLAPYQSLIRKAPVILCHSPEGADAEAAVMQMVTRHRLRPRSVTILADYDSVGVIKVADEKILGEYEVDIEPCSGAGRGRAASFGVGRIPFSTLEESSLLIARGIVRERSFSPDLMRVLMIGNPDTENSPLPLCETVSRATAAEFKNLGVHIDEFYRTLPADESEVAAAEKAHMIIFEGHIYDLGLFEDPEIPDAPLQDDLQDVEEFEYQDSTAHIVEDSLQAPGSLLLVAAADERSHLFPHATIDTGLQIMKLRSLGGEPSGETAAPEIVPARTVAQLEGLPLVVLQSCHSLEDDSGVQTLNLGAVGLIGSVTNIHSASGSAFIKAFCDGLLYRGDTVGEALRDARNYFICLAALKAERGHSEQPKTYRAGLGFCLWGDPELRVFQNLPRQPKRVPVSARFGSASSILVSVPDRRLPECRTEQYVAHIFPGSQLAGIVKRLKDKPERRLMPLYFFRVPAPERLLREPPARLVGSGDDSVRAVFLTDPIGRNVYVLYFPKKEKRGEIYTLRFMR